MKILTLAALLFCLVFGVRANVSAAGAPERAKLAVNVTLNTFYANSKTPLSGAVLTVERCLEIVGALEKRCGKWSTVFQRLSTTDASIVFGANAHTRYRFTVSHHFMYCVSECRQVIDIGTEPITETYYFIPGANNAR